MAGLVYPGKVFIVMPMLERYDLKQLLEEIREDELIGDEKQKIVSQDDIKKMFIARKNKKGTGYD